MTKEWENEIPLFNRYGSELYLEYKENNIYYLSRQRFPADPAGKLQNLCLHERHEAGLPR